MCDNHQDSPNKDGSKLGEELGRLFKMGVGAVAGAVEKSKNFVEELTTEGTEANAKATKLCDDLTRKGEEAITWSKEVSEDLVGKVKSAVQSIPLDFDHVKSATAEFTEEQLRVLRDRIDELIVAREKARAEKPEERQAEAEDRSPEGEASEQTPDETAQSGDDSDTKA